MHNLTTRDFYAKILCKYLRGPEGSTKTITENWDSKTPTVGTILFYFKESTLLQCFELTTQRGLCILILTEYDLGCLKNGLSLLGFFHL